MRIDAPIITGSFSLNGDTFQDLGAYTTTGSNTFIGNQIIEGTISASELSGSIDYTNLRNVPTLVSGSSQIVNILSSLNTYTGSNDTTNTNQNNRLGSLENKTGSLATTGSNSFFGTQTFSGSVFIANDLVVQGSSSIQYISASSVSIGTNIVQLNTATPSVRYAGLSVQDSGSSAGVTGSMLWDSLCNRWIYSNPSGVGYSGGMLLSGPRTQTLGTEPTLTCNYIAKSGGGDHLYDSCIIDDGTTTCIKNNLIGTGTATIGSDIILSAANPVIYGGTAEGGVSISNNTGGSYIKIFGASHVTTPNTTTFINANSTVLTINECGSVGIGTPTPCTMLHVQGQATIGCSTYRTRIDGSSAGTWISFGTLACSNLLGRIGTFDSSYVLDSNNGNISFRFAGAEKAYINSSGQACFLGSITAQSGVFEKPFATNGTSLIVRQTTNGGNGNQDIGLLVDIQGANDDDRIANFRYYDGSTFTSRMVIKRGGKVGIGCTTPQKNLTVDGCIGMSNTYNWGITNDNDANWGFRVCSAGPNYSTFISYAGDAGSDRRGGIYNQNGHWVAYGNCLGHFIVQCNLTVGGSLSGAGINGTLLSTTTQRLSNSTGGFANMVQKVHGAAGSFSQLVICVNLNGPGGWSYIINSGGTGGGQFQSGGGYINGPGNFSHTAPVGSGFTVTCHTCAGTDNVVRFVSSGGVHPFVSIQAFGSLSQYIDDSSIYIAYS
jgi:hypothetical protein